MKKILILGILLFVGYKLYVNGHLPFVKKPGAFDADGKAIVRLFVGPGCESMCSEIESMLKNRKIDYDLVDVASPENEKYSVRQYPLIQVGSASAAGGRWEIIGALATQLGPEVLSRSERMAMDNHFDDKGRPIVVMYGTTWCPHCKTLRAYFNSHDIPFTELDPEQSATARTAYTILEGGGYPLTYVGYQRFVGNRESDIKDAVAALR